MPPRAAPPPPPKATIEANGKHWRFESVHGPVHIWLPDAYDPLTAGIVVYVHGLGTTVDGTWSQHNLATQFAASRKNAVFVACEAPQTGSEQPLWDSLSALLDAATTFLRSANELAPQVPDIVVAGHSGAYRTLTLWLQEPIRHLILVDALYGNEDAFAAWIDASRPAADGRYTRQLTIVAYDTHRWVEPFIHWLPDVVVRIEIPESVLDFTAQEQQARILYMPSQYGHMELISDGKALPILLQQTALLDLMPIVGIAEEHR